jgi:hypothetical protein
MFRTADQANDEAGGRWSKADERARPPRLGARDDRRAAHRYAVGSCPVKLHWSGQAGWTNVEGTLLEVALGGAAVLVPEAPEPGRLIVLSIEGDAGPTRIEARALGATRDSRGGLRVRLALTGGCPYEVFKRLVWSAPVAQARLDRSAPG